MNDENFLAPSPASADPWPRRTAALLREQLAGATIGLFGDRVHVATRDAARDEPHARRLISGAGFEVLSIRPIEPSLEDVFVSVLATKRPRS